MTQTITSLICLDGTNAHANIGSSVTGTHSGPTLLVSGYSATTCAIYDRILALPSIGHLRGKLVLVHIDRLGTHAPATAWLIHQIGPVDDNLFLPFLADDRLPLDAHHRASEDDYWTIFAKMAALGMITGRGVASSRTVAHMAAWNG